MSKTRHRYLRLFTCTGSNTEYYRMRNRNLRNRNRNNLRTLLTNYDIDEVNERVYTIELPKENQRDEPTDGHWAVTIKTAPRERYSYATDRWYNAKIKSKLRLW